MKSFPVSKGFYNWRDKSPENIEFLKSMINDPIEDIRKNPESVYWNDEWGELWCFFIGGWIDRFLFYVGGKNVN